MPLTSHFIESLVSAATEGNDQPIDDAEIKIGLFLDAPSNGVVVEEEDFTLPNPAHYALKTPEKVGPHLRTDGRWTYTFTVTPWNANTGTLPVTFKGVYLMKDITSKLILAWRFFDTPAVLTNAANMVDVTFRVSLKDTPGLVESIVVND